MTTNKTQTKTLYREVQQDSNGNYFIELGEQALAELGLQDGDRIRWEDNGDGSWTITRAE